MQRVRRGLILFLAGAALLLVLAAWALRVPAVGTLVRTLPLAPGLDPTPRPPLITAAAGPLPAGLAGLRELAQVSGSAYQPVGSGFLLRLPSGSLIGVTTAHSLVALGQPGNALQHVALARPGAPVTSTVAEFSRLYGLPGQPFSGDDFSVDAVLLQGTAPANGAPDNAAPELTPDARGGPQPGERAALYSGLGGADSAVRVLLGTVTSSTPTSAWLLMDDDFDPNGMSGSPVLSAYTGRVVGMAVAATHKRGRLLIGLNPISAILARALKASSFPLIAAFTR